MKQKKIEQALANQINMVGSATEKIPVLITYHGMGDNLELFSNNGLQIKHIHQDRNAVSGMATVRGIQELSNLNQVDKIEFDSQMKPIDL